jgi:hypothetical protein
VCALVLVTAAAMRQIPRSDDQVGVDPADQDFQSGLDLRVLACTRVKIGYMEDASRHDRMRL